MKTILKLILIGTLTTLSRIIGQFLIPAGSQSVLQPSIFAQNGTMPLAFTLYGILAYTGIAALFLLFRGQMTGPKLWQGLKYGIACSLIWIVYLWEPLPHVAPLDRITYPLIDSLALLVMGLCLGWLFGDSTHKSQTLNPRFQPKALLSVTSCFVIGRLIQYLFFDIYSSFTSRPWENLAWALVTGLVVAAVLIYLSHYLRSYRPITKALLLGGLFFGLQLTLFNFFMPLVFAADIPDLILRTVVDFTSVTLGCLALEEDS